MSLPANEAPGGQYRDDLRVVLSTPAGRRFVWGLAEHVGVFALKLSDSALTLAMAEGRRSVGVQLLDEARVWYPELFAAMHREAVDVFLAEVAKRSQQGRPQSEVRDG